MKLFHTNLPNAPEPDQLVEFIMQFSADDGDGNGVFL